MTDPQDKDLLTLYRRSRQEEPSQLTDTRIRQAALKAVSVKPAETPVTKNRNWLLGLSTAAVLVLSFSVVLQVWMDNDEPMVIQQESSPAPVSKPKLDFKLKPKPAPMLKPEPSFDGSEQHADDRADNNMDRASGMPAPAVEESMPTFSMRDTVPREELSEVARDREVFRKKALAPARTGEPSTLKFDPPDPLVIPQLPDSVKDLQAITPGLVVEQSESGLIAVYSGNKLILAVQHQPQGSVFKAWPGSEALGVEMNWQLSPPQLQGCVEGPVYLKCPVKRNVDAHFEGDRLDFIQWLQD